MRGARVAASLRAVRVARAGRPRRLPIRDARVWELSASACRARGSGRAATPPSSLPLIAALRPTPDPMTASLHPLSLACIEVGDGLLHELLAEVADQRVRGDGDARRRRRPRSRRWPRALASDRRCPSGWSRCCRWRRASCGAPPAPTPPPAAARAPTSLETGPRAGGRGGDLHELRRAGRRQRFAPHLDKCMLGKGRAASRKANGAARPTADAARARTNFNSVSLYFFASTTFRCFLRNSRCSGSQHAGWRARSLGTGWPHFLSI